MKFETLLDQFKKGSVDVKRYIPDKFAKYAMYQAIPYLIISLQSDEELIVRIECAESLGKLGVSKAIDPLVSTYQDPDPELRRTVIWSLGQIGTNEVLECISLACSDSSPLVRRWAIKSLSRVRSNALGEVLHSFYPVSLNDPLVVEKYRTISKCLKKLHSPNLWFRDIMNNLTNISDPILLRVQLELLGMPQGIAFLKENDAIESLIELFDKSEPLVPYFSQLCEILRKLGMQFLLTRRLLLEGETVKTILPHIDDLEIQLQFLDTNSLISWKYFLKTVNKFPYMLPVSKFGELQIPDNEELDSLKMQYLASHGLPLDQIEEFIEQTDATFGILRSLVYYGKQGLEVIEKYVKSGNKNQRKQCLEVLIHLSLQFPNNKSVENLLTYINMNDRIWHFRRDARIALSVRARGNSNPRPIA